MMVWLSVVMLIILSCKGCYADPHNTDLSKNPDTLSPSADRVELKVFYECMCPHCRHFFKDQLIPLEEKLEAYVDLHIVPYGKAQTFDLGGLYDFSCQHGPPECYGNKLHACAIHALNDVHKAVLFNACLMDMSRPGNGSDDSAANLCGDQQKVEAEPIIQCAKSAKGSALLRANGEETHQVTIKHVPHITVNGELLTDPMTDDVFKEVCKAIKNAPAACKE